MATICLKKRDIEAAQKYINKAELLNSYFHPIVLLKLYIFLVEKKTHSALQILSDTSLPPISFLGLRGKFNNKS